MTRQHPSVVEPPPDAAALRAVAVWHVLADTVLFRVTGEEHGPWWFSSDGSGRFDLEPPRGTCYLADEPAIAVLEALGPAATAPVVAGELLATRLLWTVALPAQCDAADLTARRTRGLGVTGELATMPSYSLPRRWAAALAGAGFGGLRYRARHDPSGGRCLALFGAAGERRCRKGRPQALRGELARDLLGQIGVTVADRPDDAGLDGIND